MDIPPPWVFRRAGASPSIVAVLHAVGTGEPDDRDGVDEAERLLATLSPRELEVLSILATGASNQAIADALTLSLKTVDTHVRSVYGKLRLPEDPLVSRRVLATLAYARRWPGPR